MGTGRLRLRLLLLGALMAIMAVGGEAIQALENNEMYPVRMSDESKARLGEMRAGASLNRAKPLDRKTDRVGNNPVDSSYRRSVTGVRRRRIERNDPEGAELRSSNPFHEFSNTRGPTDWRLPVGQRVADTSDAFSPHPYAGLSSFHNAALRREFANDPEAHKIAQELRDAVKPDMPLSEVARMHLAATHRLGLPAAGIPTAAYPFHTVLPAEVAAAYSDGAPKGWPYDGSRYPTYGYPGFNPHQPTFFAPQPAMNVKPIWTPANAGPHSSPMPTPAEIEAAKAAPVTTDGSAASAGTATATAEAADQEEEEAADREAEKTAATGSE